MKRTRAARLHVASARELAAEAPAERVEPHSSGEAARRVLYEELGAQAAEALLSQAALVISMRDHFSDVREHPAAEKLRRHVVGALAALDSLPLRAQKTSIQRDILAEARSALDTLAFWFGETPPEAIAARTHISPEQLGEGGAFLARKNRQGPQVRFLLELFHLLPDARDLEPRLLAACALGIGLEGETSAVGAAWTRRREVWRKARDQARSLLPGSPWFRRRLKR